MNKSNTTNSNILSIADNQPFLESLAIWLTNNYQPQILSRALILVPNRRSCRSLKELLLEHSKSDAMILPKIEPIGESEPLDLITENDLLGKKIISEAQKKLIITSLVNQIHRDNVLNYKQKIDIANNLIKTLNELQNEEIDTKAFEDLVPEQFAKHWQINLTFLKIIWQYWPQIMMEENAIDIITMRNNKLKILSNQLAMTNPDYPVIVAGSTGSVKATAQLLQTITSLKNGKIILPGIDIFMDEAAWQNLSPSHPQKTLHDLLILLNKKRDDVEFILSTKEAIRNNVNLRFISEIMSPAPSVQRWQKIDKNDFANLSNISLIEADNISQEAQIIFYKAMEIYSKNKCNLAIITNDDKLVRHIKNIFAAHKINIDSGFSDKLSTSNEANFFLAITKMIISNFAAIEFLSLVKHQFFAQNNFDGISFIEKTALRGIKPTNNLLLFAKQCQNKDVSLFLNNLLDTCQIINKNQPALEFNQLIEKHIKIATTLSNGKIWLNDIGQSLLELLHEIKQNSNYIGKISVADYQQIIKSVINNHKFNSQKIRSNQIVILPPMEARLQKFDYLILAGLNKNSWPGSDDNDPWLSNFMRQKLGLDSGAKKICLSAHDFCQFLAYGKVILTRSKKIAGSKANLSPFLLRIKIFTKIIGYDKLHEDISVYKDVLEQNYLKHTPCLPPEPKPPFSARPRKLSATAIEKLLGNPYVIYAQKILNLSPLDPIGLDPSAADYGNFIHQALQKLVDSLLPIIGKSSLSKRNLPDSENVINNILSQELKNFDPTGNLRYFWFNRGKKILQEMLKYFLLLNVRNLLTEIKGEFTFESKNGSFTLDAKADLIEIDHNNRLHIIDYKTGQLPFTKDLNSGTKPQLALEALIAMHGGFMKNISTSTENSKNIIHKSFAIEEIDLVKKISFFGLAIFNNIPQIQDYSDQKLQELIKQTYLGLVNLINYFDDDKSPYIVIGDNANNNLSLSSYNHLARIKEWLN